MKRVLNGSTNHQPAAFFCFLNLTLPHTAVAISAQFMAEETVQFFQAAADTPKQT